MAAQRAKSIALLLVGLGLLGGLLAYVGPAHVAEAVSSASPLYLGLAILAYLAFFLVRGWRWRMLFARSAPDVRLSSTTGLTALGWLANSILPLKGGDVLRAALLAKRDKVGVATSASTVALERVLDLLGLAVVAAIGLRLLPHSLELPGGLARAFQIVWILPLLGLAVLTVLVVFRAPAMRTAEATVGRMGRVGKRLVEFLDTIISGLDALARRPSLLARLLPLTAIIAVLQALVFTFLVAAFIPGTNLGLAFAGATIFLLSFVVSITPGNVGTYEAAFVAVYVALGIPSTAAVPAAILTHLTTTLIVAVCGSLALLALGLEDQQRSAWRPLRQAQGGSP